MTETWRLLDTYDVSPAVAMGLDEVLLESHGPPTLRLYTWRPDALSLGYFQRLADVPAASRIAHVVRRVTGGGAIHHHAGELTFSITADAQHALYRGPVAESYRRVHAALIDALRTAGIDDRIGLAGAGGGLGSDRPGTGMCFHASTPLDVVWMGRKGVGSAQRRTRGRVLHHGSIKLGPSPHEPGIATAAEAGVATTPRAFAPHLAATLARTFDADLRPEGPTADELALARERGARHGSPEFVHRR